MCWLCYVLCCNVLIVCVVFGSVIIMCYVILCLLLVFLISSCVVKSECCVGIFHVLYDVFLPASVVVFFTLYLVGECLLFTCSLLS